MRRLIRSLAGVRCPLCRERTRHLIAHNYVNHYGEVVK